MSDRRVLGFSWLALSVCLWFVMQDLSRWVLTTTGIANPEFFAGAFDSASLIGIVLAVAISMGLWRYRPAHDFSLETVQETRKVVWPTRKETRDHTLVVVVTSIIISLILWGFDQVWKQLFSLILSMDA